MKHKDTIRIIDEAFVALYGEFNYARLLKLFKIARKGGYEVRARLGK